MHDWTIDFGDFADFACLYMYMQSYRRFAPALQVGLLRALLGLPLCDGSSADACSRWLADDMKETMRCFLFPTVRSCEAA